MASGLRGSNARGWYLGGLLALTACSDTPLPSHSLASESDRSVAAMKGANAAGAASQMSQDASNEDAGSRAGSNDNDVPTVAQTDAGELNHAADGGATLADDDAGLSLECYSPDKTDTAYLPGAQGCPCSGKQFVCVGVLPQPVNLICMDDHWQSVPDGTTCWPPPANTCDTGHVAPTASACSAAYPDCYPVSDGTFCGVVPGACRTDADCPAEHRGINGGGFVAYTCIGPSVRVRCGPHIGGPAPACSVDSQCNAGQICRPDPTVPTGRNGPSAFCVEACAADLDCTATETCESSGHCRPRSCAECPSYFACTNGSCIVPTCTADSDCPGGGYCVNTRCAGSLGSCELSCS
jgi:hypothetical protein